MIRKSNHYLPNFTIFYVKNCKTRPSPGFLNLAVTHLNTFLRLRRNFYFRLLGFIVINS